MYSKCQNKKQIFITNNSQHFRNGNIFEEVVHFTTFDQIEAPTYDNLHKSNLRVEVFYC